MAHVKRGEQQRPPDPRQIRVLVVDSKQNSRAGTIRLLHECSYQAVGVQTGSEALQLLQGQVQTAGEPGVDIIFKEHEPPSSNAARFLKQLQADAVLRTVPVIVVSSYDSRDVVLKCLSLGASDYWIKPLRVNEIRNLWTRVWWRKVSTVGAQLDTSSDDASQYTKNLEEQEPTSKEGSAPDGDAQLLTNNVGHASGHGSGNGSSGVAGGAQLNVPDASGNGNGSSGNGEKGHVGSNTGMGSGDGVGGPRSNGGNGHGGGSGQLGSGNGASAVANGHGSNDGTGTANHVGSNFGNGNCKGKGSNGNGHGGNHEEYNFGNGAPDRGSNGAGVTTNGNAGYDASTTARPTPQAHHAHHSNPQHQHHGKHRHHGYDALAQQAQRANPHLQQGLFQSPPPRPRMAGSSPEVRPTFASAFATAERYFSGTTNGYGSSNGNGGTSAVAAVPQVDKLSKASSKAPHDQQVPAGFTAWASLHSDPAHGGLTNEVAEVAEALTSLRDSGDSPGDSRAGRGEGSNRPSPTPQNVVKPTTLRLSRGAACDETRMPNTRAGAAAAVAAATAAAEPGASSAAATGKVGEYAAPRNMAAWSDPGRGQPSLGGLGPPPSAATAPGAFSAHFPRGSVQMPAPLIASAQQAQQQHSMGSLPPPPASLMPPQQMAQQGGGMFGQFPPPPFGPMPPPFMQPPMAFPWGDPGQIHPGMGPSGGPPPFPFPFGGGSGQYMPQGSQEMMAVQQMMAVQHNYQQQFMMPFQGMHGGAQGFGPPPAFPSNPWGRSPAGPWGRQGQPQPQQVPQQMPPPTMHAPTAGGGAPTTRQHLSPT